MKIEHKPKLLVRRRASLGDVIMTTGIVRELYKKYNGEVEISVVTEYTEVFANNPYVKHVYHTNRPMGGMVWDIEYNLDNAYEINPCNHYIDSYFFRVFGNNNLDKSVELYPSNNDLNIVNEIVEKEISSPFVVFHMRHWAWEFKNVRPEIWQEVINRLMLERPDIKIVIVGNTSDYDIKDVDKVVSLHSRLSPTQMKALFDRASAFVGPDSGPYASASASNVPIVPLLSHLKPLSIVPYRNNELGYKTIPVVSQIECAGCYEEQVRPVTSVICKWGDNRCNGLYNVDQILKAILKSIS